MSSGIELEGTGGFVRAFGESTLMEMTVLERDSRGGHGLHPATPLLLYCPILAALVSYNLIRRSAGKHHTDFDIITLWKSITLGEKKKILYISAGENH